MQKISQKKVTIIYCDLALSGNDQTCFTKWEHSINNIESEGSDNLSKTAYFKKMLGFWTKFKMMFSL